MTDEDILQSRYDHAHLRLDIMDLVRKGTPSRWSTPLRRVRQRRGHVVFVRDFSDNSVVVIKC